MRDGLGRRLVKWVARVLGAMELNARRAIGPRPQYLLRGECNGCGRCCEAPSLSVGKATWRVPLFKSAVLWWQRAVNGFELTGEDARFRVLTFRCTHYDPATKTCDSYDSRPLMCRDYPVNLTHDIAPVLFEECGYRVVDRNAKALRQALIDKGVSGEKLEELEKKLFLRE